MKYRIALLFIVCTFFLSWQHSVKAQEQNQILVVVNYKTREDLDILFSNSERVLEYVEGEDAKEPFLLALVNKDKLSMLEEQFKTQALEENPDISRFVLVYHPLPNQAHKLSSFGQVFAISPHYAVIKLAEGQEFSHEGVGGEFFDIPFSEKVVTPPYKTKTITAVPTKAIVTSTSQTKTQTSRPNLLLPIIVIVFIVMGIAGAVLLRRKLASS